MANYSLITVNELRNYPGMESIDASKDPLLDALIDGATADFESEWGSPGVQRSFTERVTYQEIKRSKNSNVIWLNNLPLSSVTSITDPDGNTVDSDEYWIDYDKGALRTTGGWTIPQDSNGFDTYWTVVYTAGRVSSTADVPANIKLACKMWVAKLYKSPTQDVQSKEVGDLRITYKTGSGETLPEQIRRMITAWKKYDA